IANSIVSAGIGPAGSGNCTADPTDSPTSKGFNLESANDCRFTAPGDQANTDPQLGPLGPNGGPTPTMLPSFTSPAVDRGVALGLASDQRGVVRPIDFPSIPNAAGSAGSDVGAVELQPSNAFGFGKLTKNKKKGTARLTVNLPTPNVGVIALRGNGLKPQTKAVTGTTSKVTFVVALKSKKLKKALRKKGKRKVGIKVTYTPVGNAALTKVRKAKLVRKQQKPKRQVKR
ncbi:MAG TPA: choice-of-anchor Q domain-containing protein, partial [Solirubrobacterales bacterium]|nr:choice-of-anchor Q domain-containing protein [Solirubrobacterales bacterium]